MNALDPGLPPAGEPPEPLLRTVRALCESAHRIDGALADPDWLLRLLSAFDGPAGRLRLAVHGRPARGWPAGCQCRHLASTPRPQIILFYGGAADFPAVGLTLAGESDRPWAAFHRRPLVLQRLQGRFARLWGTAGRETAAAQEAFVGAAAIREEGTERSRATEGASTPRLVPPASLYTRVLAVHFEELPHAHGELRPPGAPALAAHQRRAYERARTMLDRYGGVIVADAVGLGKTYIGLRFIERYLATGGRVLVIVPAALKRQWRRHLSYLDDRGASEGKLQRSHSQANLDLWIREHHELPLDLVSVESLGRRGFPADRFAGSDLILVDEAHNFRNARTRRYRQLMRLARHAGVVLLTATPINNSPRDLQHLIDLFAAPGAFRHLGIADYRRAFRPDAGAALELRRIISACVVRRTRRFLRSCYGELRLRDAPGTRRVLTFPERRPPVPVEYDLAGTYGDISAGLAGWLEDLEFPAFDGDDVHGRSPAAPAELIKIILLKRLESSVEAFRTSVMQQLAWCDTALRALSAGRILRRPEYRATFRGPADDPGSQLALFELMLPPPATERHRIDTFRAALERDRRRLAQMHSALVGRAGPGSDRKLGRLLELLDGPLSGRKLIVFTEFRDTARYLHRRLARRPHIAQIDSGRVRLGNQRAGRREVIERFAPASNGVAPPPDRERVDLLVATDVLSEGLDLQDASAVISYDLPWNPVRLMQRIGRIDRLGAVPPAVQLFHFLPARQLEALLRLVERLQTKVATIAVSLGLDAPLLGGPVASGVETIRQIRRLADGRTGFEAVERELEGPLDPEERAYLDFVARGRPSASGATHPRAAAVRAGGEAWSAVGYWTVASGHERRPLWLVYEPARGGVREDPEHALDALRSARNGADVTPPSPLLYTAHAAFARYATAVAARIHAVELAGDRLTPHLPQCRIAAWLAGHLERSAPRLAALDRARIDRLLEALARRFTLAAERGLARVAGSLPAELDGDAIEGIERELDDLEPAPDGTIASREIATLLLLPP